MRTWLVTSLLSLTLLSTACVVHDGDSTLTVENSSSYVIEELYLAQIDDPSWGPDLLGNDVLFPGESTTLLGIDCDTYDVMVIDELGADCVLESISLCFDDAVWVITNSDLSWCDNFGALAADDSRVQKAPQLR